MRPPTTPLPYASTPFSISNSFSHLSSLQSFLISPSKFSFSSFPLPNPSSSRPQCCFISPSQSFLISPPTPILPPPPHASSSPPSHLSSPCVPHKFLFSVLCCFYSTCPPFLLLLLFHSLRPERYSPFDKYARGITYFDQISISLIAAVDDLHLSDP